VRFGDAIDLYIAYLARAGRQKSTRDGYFRNLCHFEDEAGLRRDVATLELVDYERFVDRWTNASPSTLASGVSLARGFSRFLYERGLAATDVAEPIKRPRKKRPEDLAGALAKARLNDVDFGAGTIRFFEKGGKVAVKPMPDEYLAILCAAKENGVRTAAEDYLIPNRRPAAVRRAERSNKVIWDTVRRVAARSGIECHVHAQGGLCREARRGESRTADRDQGVPRPRTT
jgi:site-specific recombinase XerD